MNFQFVVFYVTNIKNYHENVHLIYLCDFFVCWTD